MRQLLKFYPRDRKTNNKIERKKKQKEFKCFPNTFSMSFCLQKISVGNIKAKLLYLPAVCA